MKGPWKQHYGLKGKTKFVGGGTTPYDPPRSEHFGIKSTYEQGISSCRHFITPGFFLTLLTLKLMAIKPVLNLN